MRSWDPMRNFPELDALSDDEAKTLILTTQRKVARRPVILLGLLLVLGLAAFLIASFVSTRGLAGGAIIGGLVGVVAIGYMVLVIKPLMRAEFLKQGYPR